MDAGHLISGVGHLGLIGWLILGGLFERTSEPFEMTEVAVISGADFDAMVAAAQPPAVEVPVAQPVAPTPEPETNPEPEEIEAPQEPPEVSEIAPPVEDVPPDLSEPVGDIAVLVPEVAPEAAPRPIERVAPEPVAQPVPEATPDVVEQEAVTPDETGETEEQETQEATAPEEATTEIVTEATAAPAASARPPGRRPAAPLRQTAAPAEEASDTAPDEPASAPVSNDDVLAALQAAQEPAATAPSGPPLSRSERDGLKAAISRCWNVGAISTEAKATVITVALAMNRNGKPDLNTIRLLRVDAGSDAAAQTVFRTARSAIARCGSSGFGLPDEKFSQWQNMEITFDASKMGF